MIARLIFQDPAFRRLPVWVAVALIQVGVVAAFLFWALSSGKSVSEPVVAALIWFPVTLFLVFGEIGTRASRFHLALPLPTRQLWLSHLIAVGLTGVAVLAIAATFTTSALVLQRKLVGGELIGTGAMVAGGGLLVAGLILAVVMLQAYRPDAQEVPMSTGRAGWSLLVSVGSFAAALILWPLGLTGALILVAVAATALVPIYRRLPVALSIPARAGRAAAGDDAVPDSVEAWKVSTPDGGLWMALRTVYGVSVCSKKSFVIWIIVPFLAFMAFLMSVDSRPESSRFAYPFMIVYVIMVVTALTVSRLGAIDWLPWSRRRTFALFSMPLLLATVIGYGAGSLAQALGVHVFGQGESLCISKNRRSGDYYLCVLPAASRVTWGTPPEITTPWGERHEPWSRPVVRGLPVRAWFPYSVPQGSSPAFAALQISRAVEDLFGQHIPPDEIESRYLRTGEDGSVVPVRGGLTLQADYPGLRPLGGGVYFPWLMAEVVALWALFMAGAMSFLRRDVGERRRKVMAWVFIAIPMALWVGDMFLEASGTSTIFARSTLFIELSRKAGATTVGTVATWLGSALVAWAAYRLAEHSFERAELIPDRVDTCATD